MAPRPSVDSEAATTWLPAGLLAMQRLTVHSGPITASAPSDATRARRENTHLRKGAGVDKPKPPMTIRSTNNERMACSPPHSRLPEDFPWPGAARKLRACGGVMRLRMPCRWCHGRGGLRLNRGRHGVSAGGEEQPYAKARAASTPRATPP